MNCVIKDDKRRKDIKKKLRWLYLHTWRAHVGKNMFILNLKTYTGQMGLAGKMVRRQNLAKY